MKELIFYPVGNSAALWAAAARLQLQGYTVVTSPGEDVTHLLLPVPSLEDDGSIRGGESLEQTLKELPQDVTVIGGKLGSGATEGRKTIDLLADDNYLADNAAITAQCAVKLALQLLPVTLQGCYILVIGCGRIGKHLAALLTALGARVTIAARSSKDRALARSFGYASVAIDALGCNLSRFRVIFNTVPAPVLSAMQMDHCRDDCLKIDLASTAGMAGKDVIRARGLPGRDAPESSGDLIARSIIRLIQDKE